jgi:MoxR-like ATPase
MTDLASLASLADADARLRAAVSRRVVGQAATVDAVLTALFAGGHALLVGAPGTAKTLLVSTLCEALGWRFKRIQFTPDLMPADVLGSEVLREDRASGARSLEYVPGPVFANLVLADEINRTPPKTQSALLEAMQERAVTVGGHTRALPAPFHVLATQNPIEQEGTYPLPEAQLDRFLLAVPVEYPGRDEELAIAALDTVHRAAIEPVLALDDFARLRELVARLPVPETAVAHAVDLCRATRPQGADAWVKEHVAWGAGPRAAQALVACARARAARAGRPAAEVADVRAIAPLVLAHRLVPSFQAAGAGLDGRAIAARIIEQVRP